MAGSRRSVSPTIVGDAWADSARILFVVSPAPGAVAGALDGGNVESSIVTGPDCAGMISDSTVGLPSETTVGLCVTSSSASCLPSNGQKPGSPNERWHAGHV